MGRFSGSTRTRPAVTTPMTTTGTTRTHEGGQAWARDAKSELFLFAAVNMVGQDTFYEGASDRDLRFRELVHTVTLQDADWVARFVPYLRTQMNMRTASVVMAAESAWARLEKERRDPMKRQLMASGEISIRQLVDSACARPDEPAEFLGYWWSRYGKNLPAGVKRGLADAATRLYTERAVLKYDGQSRTIRMGDVLEVTHPKPKAPWQGLVFKYLLDQRHHGDGTLPLFKDTQLNVLVNRARLDSIPVEDRRAFLEDHEAETFTAAGMTWESLSGWLQGPMDAKAWEKIIPSMGVMALIRNLRNFDEAGISNAVHQQVVAKLVDVEEIERSRAFPFRFLSAYLAAPSLRWGWALEQAISLSTRNIPELPGRTLVLNDTSASMRGTVSEKSSVEHVDVGSVFAAALATKGANVDLWEFASTAQRTPVQKGAGVLKTVELMRSRIGQVGHGTETAQALRQAYDGHDRVVIVTDGQAFLDRSGWGPRSSVSSAIPAGVPMYGINTTGYAQTSLDLSQPNRYEIGGFSDKLFTMMAMLEQGKNADWPF